MNVTITNNSNSSTFAQYDIPLNTSSAITDYSIYYENDYNGSSNQNIYWGLGASGTQHSLTNSTDLFIGNSNGSFTESNAITDGLVSNSTSSNSANVLNKVGTGTLTLSATNTYTGGTNISGGTLQLGAANALPSTGTVTFAGGTLKSGSSSGYSDNMGAVSLSANSTIALGSGSHSLNFSGIGTLSSGKTLTVIGWQGSGSVSGTAGKIFIGTSASLTTAQLAQISFSGFSVTTQLSTGEIVPMGIPTVSSIAATTPIGSQASNTVYFGQPFTITGTGFTGATAVNIGGTFVSYTVVNSTTISATVPTGLSTSSITVTTAGGTSTAYTAYSYLGYITTASGDWSSTGTWVGGTVPSAGSTVTVNNTTSVSGSVSAAPVSITINSGASLTFNNASGAITTTQLVNNGTLAWTAAGTLTMAASGNLTNNGTFTSGAGSVNFSGSNTVAGSTAITFNNVTINSGMVTLTTVPTINGTLLINGGSLSAAPIYGSSSTLEYNATYTRYIEWSATTAGTIGSTAGYPNNVTVNSGTLTMYNSTQSGGDALAGTLNVNSGATISFNGYSSAFTAGSNVSISAGGTISTGSMSGLVTVNGNLTIAGNSGSVGALNMSGMSANHFNVTGNVSNSGVLTQSTTNGVDIYVGGNWSFTQNSSTTAQQNNNGRAVFFNGSTKQVISSSTGGLTFDYIVSQNSGGGVQLSSSPATSITINTPNSGNGLTLAGTGSGNVFDLNGNSLTLGANASAQASINISGAQSITSSAGSGSLNISGGTSNTANVNGSGSLSIASAVTTFLNDGFNFGPNLTNIHGTLQINSQGFAYPNPPTYAIGSLLKYSVGSNYMRNAEWNAASGAGYPYNVEISNSTVFDAAGIWGYGPIVMNIAGNLTIDSGSAIYMDYSGHNMTVPLIVSGNINLNGALSESGQIGGDIYVGGNWVNNGSGTNFTPNGRAIVFNGSGAQSLGGSNSTAAAYAFSYLTVNNSGSGVTLGHPITIANGLTMQNGLLNPTSSNTITLLSSVSPSQVSGTTTSYVNGSLTWDLPNTVSTSSLFPVGAGGTYYPYTINSLSGSSPVITVTAYSSAPGGTPDDSTISALSNTEYWTAVLNSGSVSNATISMARQTSLGAYNAIAQSTSNTGGGSYTLSGGTVSGNGINNATVANNNLGSFAFGQTFPVPQGSLSANGPLCGSGAGQLTWTASAGNGPYTIVYNDGTANRTASSVASGMPFNVFTSPVATTTTYSLVSVTGSRQIRSNNFTGDSATITVYTLPTVSISSSNVCASVTHTASGGISYNWSGGTAPNSASNTFTMSGTYSLTVTNSFGCTAAVNDTVNVIIFPSPTITINNARYNVMGSISITMSGGTPPYTFVWSDFEAQSVTDTILADTLLGAITDSSLLFLNYRAGIDTGLYTVMMSDSLCGRGDTTIRIGAEASWLYANGIMVSNDTTRNSWGWTSNNGVLTRTDTSSVWHTGDFLASTSLNPNQTGMFEILGLPQQSGITGYAGVSILDSTLLTSSDPGNPNTGFSTTGKYLFYFNNYNYYTLDQNGMSASLGDYRQHSDFRVSSTGSQINYIVDGVVIKTIAVSQPETMYGGGSILTSGGYFQARFVTY
jgi:autotransporter-associated beta strand protein